MTDYAVTGWILYVIPPIREGVFNNSNVNHIKQVNNVIKTLFSDLSDDELRDILDTFWSEYANFNHNNDTFENDEFIWNSKYICGVNSRIWYFK